MKPTRLPTNKPTSQSPTATPSRSPSLQPSSSPSRIPTQSPSRTPTSKPSAMPTGRPTRRPTPRPTNQPSVSPTLEPSYVPTGSPSSTPTNKPTRRPSLVPSNSPTNEPTSVPTNKPSHHPSVDPTSNPTAAATLIPSSPAPSSEPTSSYPTIVHETRPPTYMPTESPTTASYQPSISYVTMNAALSFNLPINHTMAEGSITSFESTIELFLQTKMNGTTDLIIEEYNVKVVSQEVRLREESRRILQDLGSDDYLVVATAVTAKGSPADLASRFPFQAAAHSVITKNSDELFQEIYLSTLKQLEQASSEITSVDIAPSNDGSKLKNIVGSSAAGVVLLAALLSLLIMRRRREIVRSNVTTSNQALPPASHVDVARADAFSRDHETVSSIDDNSLLSSGKVPPHPNNIPHYNPDGANRSIDQWSLHDNHHVQPADAVNSNDIESNIKTSHASSLKRVSFVQIDEASETKHVDDSGTSDGVEGLQHHDPSLVRLYEKSIPEDEDSKASPVRPASQTYKSSSGFKMFSCFTDNTFEDTPKPTLTAQKILQEQYRSNVTSKTTDDVYEVRAPPGALGIVIDSNDNGPFVHEVKATSPLNGQVEVGDKIVSIDGWHCEACSSHQVANWIRKKPKRGEQVLVLKAKPNDIDEESL